MFDRISKLSGRKAVLATAAVLALSTVASSPSFAGGRHWHGGGAAFAGAAIAGAIGTGLAIAATRNAYAYDAPGYYGGGPVYYDDGPVYYGGDSYIGPRPFHRCGGPYQSAQGGQGYASTCY